MMATDRSDSDCAETQQAPDAQPLTFSPRVSRRRVLGMSGAGAAGLLVGLPAAVLAQPSIGTSTATSAAQSTTSQPPALRFNPLLFFTLEQAQTVDAVAGRLIPSDDNGPGATEAFVWRYIDRLVTTPMNTYHGPNNPDSDLQDAYVAGLAALDAYAKATHGDVFVSLSAAGQDAVLTAMEKNTATGFKPDAKTFFNLIRQHTLEGMFGDPYYGGNVDFAGWNLIDYPGIKLTYTPEEQKLDFTIPKSHMSVAQIAYFGNNRKGM